MRLEAFIRLSEGLLYHCWRGDLAVLAVKWQLESDHFEEGACATAGAKFYFASNNDHQNEFNGSSYCTGLKRPKYRYV